MKGKDNKKGGKSNDKSEVETILNKKMLVTCANKTREGISVSVDKIFLSPTDFRSFGLKYGAFLSVEYADIFFILKAYASSSLSIGSCLVSSLLAPNFVVDSKDKCVTVSIFTQKLDVFSLCIFISFMRILLLILFLGLVFVKKSLFTVLRALNYQ